MTKHIAAKVTGHTNECETRDPASDAPQEIIRRDKRHQKSESNPHAVAVICALCQAIDKKFDTVLGADRTGDSRNDRREDHDVRCAPLADVAHHKRKWSMGVA
jgi:hypothetical protein